jgi:hypothetical protein
MKISTKLSILSGLLIMLAVVLTSTVGRVTCEN